MRLVHGTTVLCIVGALGAGRAVARPDKPDESDTASRTPDAPAPMFGHDAAFTYTVPRNEGAGVDEPEESTFRGEFVAWVWLLAVDGTVGVRNASVDVSASFGDTLEASDSLFAFSGRLEIGYGRWAGYLDGMYANIGADSQAGRNGLATVDVSFEEAFLDCGVMCRVGDWKPSGGAADNPRDMTLDLYGGGRYFSIRQTLRPTNLPTVERHESWVDPIVGAEFIVPFSESWHARAMADVGGFGVASDFTWSATAVIGYDFHLFDHPSSLYFGYRALGDDYTKGGGTDEFKWNVVQHGPLLGFAFRF